MITVEKDGVKTPVPTKGFAEHFTGMKPMIILPIKTMSEEDIQLLRDNGLCVVEAYDPSLVKFVDPMPVASNRTQLEQAAIQFSRIILNHEGWYKHYNLEAMNRSSFCKLYVDCLVAGTPMDKRTKNEAEQEILHAADVICCTCVGAGEPRLKNFR